MRVVVAVVEERLKESRNSNVQRRWEISNASRGARRVPALALSSAFCLLKGLRALGIFHGQSIDIVRNILNIQIPSERSGSGDRGGLNVDMTIRH